MSLHEIIIRIGSFVIQCFVIYQFFLLDFNKLTFFKRLLIFLSFFPFMVLLRVTLSSLAISEVLNRSIIVSFIMFYAVVLVFMVFQSMANMRFVIWSKNKLVKQEVDNSFSSWKKVLMVTLFAISVYYCFFNTVVFGDGSPH